MSNPFQILGRSISLWWREFIYFMFFNLAWLALQITIIAGPPATAAMYVVARRVAEDEVLELRQYWEAMRRLFWPAWQWGAANLVIVGIVVGNFWFYQSFSSPLVALLRLVWATIGSYWFVTNLFYWPFWLAQEDHRMRTTYRNCLLFLGRQTLFVLTLAVLCAVLIVISVLTTLPLVILLMVWLAFIGLLAVDVELKRNPPSSTGIESGPEDPASNWDLP